METEHTPVGATHPTIYVQHKLDSLGIFFKVVIKLVGKGWIWEELWEEAENN